MTALAMIIGMGPMALGLGEGGEQNAPLGRAVIGGLICATFATLVFVPVVFSIVHRNHRRDAAHAPDAPVPTKETLSMQNETHRPDADLLSGKPPRGLRTAGIVAGVLAVAVVAAGLYSRHGRHSMPARGASSRRADRPSGRRQSGCGQWRPDPARHDGSLEHRAYLCPRGRLHAVVGPRYRRGGRTGHAAGPIETPELDQQIIAARAALAKAQASAALARSTAARWNDLLTDHSVSQQEADERNGNLAVQVATVRGARPISTGCWR
jgi:hypothetical protein